jgi:DNA-binding protein HU-beta
MKKSDLVDRVAEKAELSKAAAARVVDAIFDASSGAIAEAVQAGKHVSIPGFGKFRSKERAARKGRNPRTGAEIDIPASTVVSFSAGKGLKETVGKPRKKAAAGKKPAGATKTATKTAAKTTKSSARPAAKSAAKPAGKAPARKK